MFLLKLTPGPVLNISHLGFMESTHISVAALRSYSRCEKYHGCHIEVFVAKHGLFPSLRAPWAVHDVTDRTPGRAQCTELHARDRQGEVTSHLCC